MDDQTVHIFWDHSNLFHSAQDACDDCGGGGLEPGHRTDVRLDFQKLYDFAAAGRHVERAVAVGSVPPGLRELWTRLRKAGVDIDLQERGADSGKEQAVDQVLQLEMLRSLADRADRPAVAVLLTGDADFRADAQRMLDKGWGLEVLAFGGSFSNKLKALANCSHGRAKYIELDRWYTQLVYLQGVGRAIGRPSHALDLTGRLRV